MKSSARGAGVEKRLLWLPLAVIFWSFPAWVAEKSDSVTVGLMDFVTASEESKDLGGKISGLLSAQLSKLESIHLLERAELEKALGEQELGASGTVSSETAAKIGRLTGAKVLVTGRAFYSGDQLNLVAKIIGTETGRIFGETVSAKKGETPVQLADQLGTKIAGLIEAKRESLIAKERKNGDIIGKLKKLASGKQLPSVSVLIQEKSLGRNVQNATSEAELSRILLEVGFKLLQPSRESEKADLEIVGDAFNEFGMRKGNLVSSKGRLECKVIERKSGRVIAMDREEGVSVDLSEEIAGKQALQKAVLSLSERLVPKLLETARP